MEAFEAFDSLLAAASRACCSPLAVFIQIQGCIICLTLAVGWGFAAYVRNRVIQRMKLNIANGNSFAFICEDINDLEHSAQLNLPRVSVIMPLKGFGEHNLQNWRTQITSLYGGPLEFLFVVESAEDPAYHAVSSLILEFQESVDAKIVIAGLSKTCSQKIHNQLVGVERMHKDSKYVLFLDDDIRLHPGSIGALTTEMEKNPEIFIQTGYPLDLPSGSLGSYCIYEYHMPCSMGFATGGKTFFLWGGCMMMHAQDFRNDLYGVVSGLQDGGYSDDMTLAAIAGLSLASCLLISTVIELLSMWNLTKLEIQLCNMLSPEEPTVSLGSYNWGLVFLAMLVDNFLYPISAIRSRFSQSINWSGVRYHLEKGKIIKIERSIANGPSYSDLAWKRLYGKRQIHRSTSFISYLSRKYYPLAPTKEG
uniref:ceramide glucosyltransferase n=1 Tax=Musa acuminata subsp. malaccensis TaxID=214687 RepID=A0A804J9A4_MUSAM